MGSGALRDLGIRDGADFICFHARDGTYLRTIFAGRDWGYHDYRDSSIDNCVPAAEELTRRGNFAIRMGAVVDKELETSNPMIIDYSTRSRSDFLDIYLSAKCRFFICANDGLTFLPMIFRRPTIVTNMVPLEYLPAWAANNLIIVKKLWLRRERRFMTFREILDSGAARFLFSEQYDQLGIDPLENTPEEITDVALEMDERLNGTWHTTEEDQELQRRFWALIEGSEVHGTILSHIGAEFLRQNRELLD